MVSYPISIKPFRLYRVKLKLNNFKRTSLQARTRLPRAITSSPQPSTTVSSPNIRSLPPI